MAIRDKNTLKTFFEKGDIPSQNQFEDLIDSLKHQNDINTLVLTDQEIVSIANRLASIDKPYIEYYVENMGDSLIKLDLAQKNGQSQEIEIRCTPHKNNYAGRQYFIGNEPCVARIKEFKSEKLQEEEYYYLYYGTTNYITERLVGNKLPNTLKDLELGEIDDRNFQFRISKHNFPKGLGIVHTNIKFINKTDIPIEYKCWSSYWSDNIYRTEDTVTDHYDQWDYLSFSYNADMTKQDYTIECNIYDSDNKELLITDYLLPGQKLVNIGGRTVHKVRNILIECTKK